MASNKEIPILLNKQMVLALLSGAKTETRRPVKLPKSAELQAKDIEWLNTPSKTPNNKWEACGDWDKSTYLNHPLGEAGDTLWVRENWVVNSHYDYMKPSELELGHHSLDLSYAADFSEKPGYLGKTRPSIHMPRLFSRINLIVKDAWVERIQKITEGGAKCEGISPTDGLYREPFAVLWDSIYKEQGFGWRENPWVWVSRFELAKARIST